jgi:phosphoribosyl 1,2-cyclic phosphodiesterase
MTSSSCPLSHVIAQSFGSGSSGNALLIHSSTTTLLVDCGVGIRTLRAGLAGHGLTMLDVDAVLVTHEHRDHVQTLPKVLTEDVAVVATQGTMRAARLPTGQTEIVNVSAPASVAGATIHPLAVRHDAAEPCGFLIEIDGARITVLTDLGSWQDHLLDAALASDLVLLEANYNEVMLRHGPYPAHLKRRVASMRGHLGNDACGAAVANVNKQRGDAVTWWLAHLSATNNRASTAEQDVRASLHRSDVDASITALPRQTLGPIWRFEPSQQAHPPNPTSGQFSANQLGMPGLE